MFQKRFKKLCIDLRPYIKKSKDFEIQKQMAARLYYLADEGNMQKEGNSFGIWKSKISKI